MMEDIKELSARLSAIIDTAIDGIITISEKGIVETINAAAAKQFGYLPSEVVGNNINMLMPDPYRSEHDEYLARYQRTREPRIIGTGREVTGKTSDGKLFPFRLAVSEVVLNDRVIYTGIIHDLTEIKVAESNLIQLNKELESRVIDRTNELELAVNDLLHTEAELRKSLEKERELNELKSRFVSMASHEFRTPLSTILSSASLISKYVSDESQQPIHRHVDKVRSAVNTLTGILNDFLSLSKIEEGRIEISKEIVNIDDLIDEVRSELDGMLKGHSIKLDNKGVEQLYTDPRILRNVLFNLLSNAIKYSTDSSQIICRILPEGDQVKIMVIDHGLGIPDADQQYIFTRFFRADNVINIQGTGLGLSIVKRYVNLLDGEISFESEEGKGTTFIVTLPVSV